MDFKKMLTDRHEYAVKWKEKTGGKVLGYFEPYFPEEIAYAAGILPVRVMAEHEPDAISSKWIYGACYPAKDLIRSCYTGEKRTPHRRGKTASGGNSGIRSLPRAETCFPCR